MPLGQNMPRVLHPVQELVYEFDYFNDLDYAGPEFTPAQIFLCDVKKGQSKIAKNIFEKSSLFKTSDEVC